MSGVEVFAGLGLLATELFRYNRENYQFDQDQRFEKEEMKLKMQLERFELFREDIRDLVELTVSKMDLYHLVGALFLKGCTVYFAEGQVYAPVPPFLLALYYLSLSCAFVYLVLSVWLAMHASIASHSQGTRLLTRFVRLPIPGGRTLDRLNARLADFEKQEDALRVPFIGGTANWRQRQELESQDRRPVAGAGPRGPGSPLAAEGVRAEWGAPRETHMWPNVGKAALRAGAGSPGTDQSPRHSGKPGIMTTWKGSGQRAPSPSIYGAQHMSPRLQPKDPFARVTSPIGRLQRQRSADSRLSASSGCSASDWLDNGEFGFGGSKEIKDNESELLQAVELRTQRHVQLFRQLQARWQCYDAYARVCMALGVRQLVQAVTYFMIGVFAVDNNQLMNAFMATVAFQALAVAISVLDIHGLPCYGNLDLSLVGMLPALVACTSLCLAPRTPEGTLVQDHSYVLALAAYPLEICWFEILHWVASPTRDEAAVPSHFRSVLFMDVFGEVDDPTEADLTTGKRILTPEERLQVQMRVSAAEGALGSAQAALRRWEAVPAVWLTQVQRRRLRRARRELAIWTHLLDWELEQRRLPKVCTNHEVRSWRQLTPTEMEDDPFSGAALGPFEHFTGTGLQRNFYYDLEREVFLYETDPTTRILRLSQATKAVRRFRRAADAVRKAAAGQLKPPQQGGPGRTLSFASSVATSRPETPTGNLVRTRSALSTSTGASASPRAMSRTGSMSSRAVKIKVPRLPWFLTSFITRIVQLTWVFVGVMSVLREFGIAIVDFQEANIEEGRRLDEAAALSFEAVEVAWPHGRFFRPELLGSAPDNPGELLLGSPYAFYRAKRLDGHRAAVGLEELPIAVEPPPRGAALVCGLQAAGVPCLLAAPAPGGVSLWRPGEASAKAAVLQVEGAAWRSLAGAAVPCGGDTEEAAGAPPGPWCLLLVGWHGGEELTAILVELPGGPADPDLQRDAMLLQRSTLSLQAPFVGAAPAVSVTQPVASDSAAAAAIAPAGSGAGAQRAEGSAPILHVEPRAGRLWALVENGAVEAWDLMPLPGRHVGRWTSSWPAEVAGQGSPGQRRFRPTALCEDSDGHTLYVAGQTAGKEKGPLLLSAAVPHPARR